ncbi:MULTISPECIES: DNA-protecting protein DprA [Pseudescherichia]|uniref:DNA-protecting protein DprA n=1 Tax=Pseudescherichia TaxID=2055880 RepID=UPI001EDEA2F8|nr:MULTISPECIES: DNA-protecting protein DprA [Pseudescherichia]
MTLTEIWLRLIHLGELYGERMLEAAHFLASHPHPDAKTLSLAGLTAKQRARFFAVPPRDIDSTLAWLALPGHHLLLASDADYPPALRAITDFPGALFVKGDVSLLTTPQLAVVGSRANSWYGERWGGHFCERLAGCGLTITSGLALGIDGIAHRSALRGGGKSLAVLGNGLQQVYPRRHTALAAQLIEAGGALASEFPLAALPRPGNFPRRNRIISGLSLGVLVVEAALRSGSLVTARCAMDQGRDVFALPGALGSPGSEGPHWLIQQGAMLVSTPEEILENLHQGLRWLHNAREKPIYSSEHRAAALPFPELLANVGDEVTPVDVVAERAGQPVPVIVAQLLELELAGWIAAVPGGYVRLRRASHVRRTNVFV